MMVPSTASNFIPKGLAGLGVDLRIDCSGGSNQGKTIDCDSWGNFFNSTCWGACSASSVASGGTLPGDDGSAGTPPPAAATGLCGTFPSLCTSAGVISTAAIVGLGVVAAGAVFLLAQK